jgi:hypothetical protein
MRPNKSTNYNKQRRSHTSQAAPKSKNSDIPSSSLERTMGKPHKTLNPIEQLKEAVSHLQGRMEHAEKKVTKLHDVCRL